MNNKSINSASLFFLILSLTGFIFSIVYFIFSENVNSYELILHLGRILILLANSIVFAIKYFRIQLRQKN